MLPSFDPWLSGLAAADVASASYAGSHILQARRSQRLAALLAHATRHSTLYRSALKGADLSGKRLHELPIMRKPELMRRFDDWVTDPRLRLDDLRRFTADRTSICEPYLGQYTVWESSGSSGEPGIFVQNAAALAVYDALEALRRTSPRPFQRLLDPWYLSERIAFIGATNGHFASIVSTERLRRLNAAWASNLHEISFLQPTARLVSELNLLAPTILSTYPSAAMMLAHERLAGRLQVSLQEIWTGGETVSPAMRRFMEHAFGCSVVNSYGASEFISLASECRCGCLHLNADWAILESVDEKGRPVPMDESGSTALLTNLANHLQPLIRYDLGDRIKLHSRLCGCGSPFPVIEVQGRGDDTLVLRAGPGHGEVEVLALALTTVLEEDAGLFDFQLEQVGPGELHLQTPLQGEAAEAAFVRARVVLEGFLAEQGALGVRIHCESGRPNQRGPGGKIRRVMAMPIHSAPRMPC